MLYPTLQELVDLKAKVASRKIKANRLTRSAISGGQLSPFKGQGLEFAEVRQYSSGDDVRKIDWRVTARVGEPHIKLFTEERERKIMLLVDMRQNMNFGTRGTFKSVQAAKVAALLGWCALACNNVVGGMVVSDEEQDEDYFRPSKRESAFLKMLSSIASAHEEKIKHSNDCLVSAIDRLGSLASKSAVNSGALVFVISDFLELDKELAASLKNLSLKCQLVLISINDIADKKMPTNIGKLFFASGGGVHIIDTSDAKGHEAYKEAWRKNRQQLDELTSSTSILRLDIGTEDDPYYKLFDELRKLQYGRRG